VAGPAVDLWRLRLQAGVGIYQVRVRSTVLGRTVDPSEIDMGYAFALSGFVVRGARLKVGLQARLGVIVEADLTFASLGIVLTGDALRF
jgi:hypothetical protein